MGATSGTMRRLTVRGSRRWRRAATMIEFILILPAMVFVALFTVDMGNVILTQGSMQDAAYSAARSGAQVGGAGLDTRTGAVVCRDGASCGAGVSYASFADSVQHVPGATRDVFHGEQMTVLSGARCTNQAPGNHVTVRVTYNQKMITPGLTFLMQMTGSTINDGAWQMSVTATSRCEIVR